jgi:tRNA-dihydrouridine synthase A
MMDCTDRHFRYFLRLLSRQVLLYTEMITPAALIHGDWRHFLRYDVSEHPLALQLGGNNPEEMAHAATLAERMEYDEVNINVGCPSERVRHARFGASLMAEPDTVARCVEAMRQKSHLPVTVKTRIGIDSQDSYEDLAQFVLKVAAAGCRTFIVHSRKAWLKGLNPKQNRELPPLRYDVVYQLKQDFPGLDIVLNGGITSLGEAKRHLNHVDGVMLGREVYNNPYILVEVDKIFYGDDPSPVSRQQVLRRYMPYIEAELSEGTPLSQITRHVMGLFRGLPGARRWRRTLSEKACQTGAGMDVIEQAVTEINKLGVSDHGLQ